MQFLLKVIVGGDRCVLLYELAAPALVLLLESCFEITELLILCSKRIAQHVQLTLQLGDFLLVKLLQPHHCLMDLLDFFVFTLN